MLAIPNRYSWVDGDDLERHVRGCLIRAVLILLAVGAAVGLLARWLVSLWW